MTDVDRLLSELLSSDEESEVCTVVIGDGMLLRAIAAAAGLGCMQK